MVENTCSEGDWLLVRMVCDGREGHREGRPWGKGVDPSPWYGYYFFFFQSILAPP